MQSMIKYLSATFLIYSTTAFADESISLFRNNFLAGMVKWENVQSLARQEGAVNFYYWGGNDLLNVWMDRVVTPAMDARGVTLNPVRITGIKDVIDLVLAEINSGKGLGEGSIDVVWVNGENFATLKRQGTLFGSFAQLLPNAKNIEWDPLDSRSLPNLRDFGVATEGKEMPWSGEQYVCAVNTLRVDKADIPSTFEELRTYLEKNPGKFAYVKPPHYLGNTFVQEAIYAHSPNDTGAQAFQMPIDEISVAELTRLITPGLEYLKALEPLLLNANGGRPRYPENGIALDGLFLNSEVNFDCKFGLYDVATSLSTGKYPEGAQEFIFPKGNMIKNKNYLTIPANTSHPAAALVLVNYMASVESQISKLKNVGMPAGIDPWKLSDIDAAALDKASPGHTGVDQAALDANAAPDANATLVNVIEAVWLEYIERGSDQPIVDIVARAVKNLNRL